MKTYQELLKDVEETLSQSRKLTLQHALKTLKGMREEGFDDINEAMALAAAIAYLEEVLQRSF